MLKFLGALMLVAAGTLAGYAESHKLSLRVELLESFLRFVTAAQAEIRYAALGVEQVIRRHQSGLTFLHICEKQLALGTPFSCAWELAVRTGTQNNGLHEEDIAMLQNFGEEFGRSDVDGQLSHCELYAELTRARLQNAREEKSRKARLIQMLGIFSGICAALLLC